MFRLFAWVRQLQVSQLQARLRSRQLYVIVLSIVAVGLGLANAVPILFSAAGKLAAVPPSIGIAAVSTAGYCGFLLGPPVIGLVAERFGLGTGLGLVVIVLATITMSGPGHIVAAWLRIRFAPESFRNLALRQ